MRDEQLSGVMSRLQHMLDHYCMFVMVAWRRRAASLVLGAGILPEIVYRRGEQHITSRSGLHAGSAVNRVYVTNQALLIGF